MDSLLSSASLYKLVLNLQWVCGPLHWLVNKEELNSIKVSLLLMYYVGHNTMVRPRVVDGGTALSFGG
jgi:hypothetical protein